MIPHTIHYCWFGSVLLPKFAQKCVASWKKYCPGYTFMLWNEANFDINTVPFTAQVAKTKKWGFIVDYIRAWAVFNFGGIYLDADVELLKPFDETMLENKCFSGFENDKYIAPGLIFAGEKSSVIAKELLDFYSTYRFIKENGELNLTPSPQIFTNILLKYGLKQNNTYQNLGMFTAYPTKYFCPLSYKTGKLIITENTYSIHHYEGSWLSIIEKEYKEIIYKLKKYFGENIFTNILTLFIYLIIRIKDKGFKKTIKWYHKYLRNKLIFK
jgi:mannosyltransferase OCH1-like enzyme